MKTLALSAALLLACLASASAQINWMTWEEAVAANAKQPRKIFVDVYTDWCGWCKKMDQTTFRNPEVVRALNEDFYAVKLDAEQREDIVWNGTTYSFEAGGRRGVHGLAKELLQGRLGYPTVVFLDERIKVIQPVPGFHEAKPFAKIVHYFGSDEYKQTPWAEYSGE